MALSLKIPTLQHLLSCDVDEIRSYDIAILNLACATGLPGADDLDVISCIATLDRWATIVRRFVRDSIKNWYEAPQDFQNQRGFHHFLALVTALKHPRGLGVGYAPSAIGNYDFSDSRDDFLHGVLTHRTGTCLSLPTVFVAIGRRLGWPMHLACSKGHVFCQWVNPDGTRINLEGSCAGGGDCLPDSHYESYPHQMNAADFQSGVYLRPLTAQEEFALFLETRGHCLRDNGFAGEAVDVYRHVLRLWPKSDVAAAAIEAIRIAQVKTRRQTLFAHPVLAPVVAGTSEARAVVRDDGVGFPLAYFQGIDLNAR